MKWFWPTINDEDTALSALMIGVAVSMVVFIAYAISAFLQLAPVCESGFSGGCLSSTIIATVYLTILGGLVFMLRRRSLSFGVSLFVFTALPLALNGLPPAPYIPAVLITAVLLFQGIRGCYWFHQQTLKE